MDSVTPILPSPISKPPILPLVAVIFPVIDVLPCVSQVIFPPANTPEPSPSSRHLNPRRPLVPMVISPSVDVCWLILLFLVPSQIAFSSKCQPAIKLSAPAENTFSLFLYPIKP